MTAGGTSEVRIANSVSPHRVIMAENLVWDTGIRVGSHHYAACMRTIWGADVLWIALPWTPFHILSRTESARSRRRTWNMGRGVAADAGVRVLSPLSLVQFRNTPGMRSAATADLALRLTMPSLRPSIRRLGFDSADVVWITDPRHAPLLRRIRGAKVVYRCPDHFRHFSDIPAAIEDLEREVVERADLVVASSRALVEHLAGFGREALYVPNGVDAKRFVDAKAGRRLEGRSTPRVLYTGAMGEWFDAELVRTLADRRPDITIVLAGPIRRSLGGLLDRRNVVYLGALPYEEMPSLMAEADVGIVPFRRGGIGAAVNPIKMFEYLAAGLPVVLTGIGDLAGLDDAVSLVDTDDAFVSAIDRAVESVRAPEYRVQQKRIAAAHSWEARFALISEHLGYPISDAPKS